MSPKGGGVYGFPRRGTLNSLRQPAGSSAACRLARSIRRADEEQRAARVFPRQSAYCSPPRRRTVRSSRLRLIAGQDRGGRLDAIRPTKVTRFRDRLLGRRGCPPIADVLLEAVIRSAGHVSSRTLRSSSSEGPASSCQTRTFSVETGYALTTRWVIRPHRARGQHRPWRCRKTSLRPPRTPRADVLDEANRRVCCRPDNLTRAFTRVLTPILTLPRTTQDVRVDVGVFDALSLDTTSRESMFIVTVRNFSEFPLHLVSLSYEYEGGGGASFTGSTVRCSRRPFRLVTRAHSWCPRLPCVVSGRSDASSSRTRWIASFLRSRARSRRRSESDRSHLHRPPARQTAGTTHEGRPQLGGSRSSQVPCVSARCQVT